VEVVVACFKVGLQDPAYTETIWMVQTEFALSVRKLIDQTAIRQKTQLGSPHPG